MIRWIAHDFLLPFHSNYGPILYRFPHIARYWSKIAKFIYFTCIQHPRNFWNFANMFSTERIIWLPCMLQKIRWYAYVKSFRYNTGTWQTDRQAELLYQYREIKTIILLLAGTSKVIVFSLWNFAYFVYCWSAHHSVSQQEVKVIWQKAPHGGPIPRLGVTPGGRKLYHWIPGVGFPISVS